MPGSRVPLDEQLVAAAGVLLAAEEVVVADLVEARDRLVRRDVTADLEALAVGRGHHHRGVPPDQPAYVALHLLVAGEPRLALGRDGVDVVGAAQGGDAHLLLAGPLEQAQHHVARALAAAVGDHGVEGLEPLPGLLGIDVGQLRRHALVDHRGCAAGGVPLVAHPLIVSLHPERANIPPGIDQAVDGGPRRMGQACVPAATPVDYSPTRPGKRVRPASMEELR